MFFYKVIIVGNFRVSPFVTHGVAYLNLHCLLGMLNPKCGHVEGREIIR